MFRSGLSRCSLLAATFVVALGLGSAPARAEFITALVTNTSVPGGALVRFDSASPTATGAPVAITGVVGTLVDIDYRPGNGLLYGFSVAPSTGGGTTGNVYTINATTGAAVLASTLTLTTGGPALGLNGTAFGIDFNPVADRLRIVSNAGQNLRVNVDNGVTIADGTLNTGGTPPVTATGIVAAAYTNSVAGATSTQLYDINFSTNSVFLQNPPNDGTLSLVGALGVNASPNVGFDISGSTGIAYAALNSDLYTINLATGAASGTLGTIGGALGGYTVRGIAIAPSAVPEPTSLALVGLGLAGMGLVARRRRRAAN